MLKIKPIFITILFAILLSTFLAKINLDEFDKLDRDKHLMIVGDINLIWQEAETFKNDILEGKTYFDSGKEYTRTYLPSKIVALYSILNNSNLFKNFDKKIVNTGEKFYLLLFQIIFYYLCLYFFYKALVNFYSNVKIPNYITFFLCLEPTILQYHISFWTESIYCSLLIILMTLIISKNSSNLKFIYIGFILGMMYLQKTVSIFLIFPVIFYFFISEKDKKIYKILNIIIIYLFVLIFLGFHNYKKTGIFYVLPIQTKSAHYAYILPQIFEKNKNISYEEFSNTNENNWKIENNFDPNSFVDNYKFSNYKQKLALKEILDNKILTTKIYIKKIIHHILLNPVQNYYWHEYNKEKYEIEYHLSEDKKKWIIWRIIYSFIIYLIILIGLIGIIKHNLKLKFHIFLILAVIYYAFMLGWVGNTRYFTPSIIIISIFFGNGINSILNFYKKK
tara:strand:- start:2723 stop:4069 length:1347 start_codon:yes stop_codon:yes gene_type:complete